MRSGAQSEPAEPEGEVTRVRARVVVNCAGLYGDSVERLRDGDGATPAATPTTATTADTAATNSTASKGDAHSSPYGGFFLFGGRGG